ncbi:hypothetical protein F5X68DRAFT_257860 [Plectosphaerella plurivora]|uniref:Transcription factor domain-containing protein n=1 Tax=Plectosphaerella plurivora TaxID=936078 RepID=A0A9P9AEI6_9PEZI|nr:hypothetical protein F5X68DRAFT_257860 [Plectosphaerella plurivora]
MAAGEGILLEYFDTKVSKSLTTFSEKPLGSLLRRISLTNGSLACMAVHRAMIALSALLRYGDCVQTQRLKLSAISALGASARNGVSPENAAQHVSAGLILCILEVYAHSDTSYQWTWYIMGVRDVVAAVSLDWFDSQEDLSDLSDWVYHHEVLSKFSLRHWAPEVAEKSQSTHMLDLPKRAWDVDPRLVPCNSMQQRNNALRTLADVVDMVVPPSDPRSSSPEYRDRLRWVRDHIEEHLGSDDPNLSDPAETMARLYRLATLVYLGRASGQAGPRVNAHARAGLRLLGRLTECTRPFALIIIGFEAETDEEQPKKWYLTLDWPA